MTNFAMLLLAVGSCLAAGTALWIALTMLDSQRRAQQKKASVVRAQLVAQLQALRESVVPRGRALDVLQKEIYEPLQFLWMQADLLEPEEIHAIHRCGSMLLALRHKPSVNQTQARLAHRVIDETCSILHRSGALAQARADDRPLARRLATRLPGFASLEIESAPTRTGPQAVTDS